MKVIPSTLSVTVTTGKLDRLISEMILLSKSELDEPDWQTLKHHAMDMRDAGLTILNRFGLRYDS
jgi:hypothetical protein